MYNLITTFKTKQCTLIDGYTVYGIELESTRTGVYVTFLNSNLTRLVTVKYDHDLSGYNGAVGTVRYHLQGIALSNLSEAQRNDIRRHFKI